MRGAVIHGVLLVVMLVYGYRTWTRDKTIRPDLGSVRLWDKSQADLVAIELKTERQITRLEHRGQGKDAYWWGTDTMIEKKPKPEAKPPEPPKPAEGSGSAAVPVVAEEEIRKTHEYPLGETAAKLIENYVGARALRDLGQPTDDQKKDYKLNDAKVTLTVTFKDGSRSFLVGGSVFGGSDRYVVDQTTRRAYVLSKDLISTLEIGQSSLQLLDPRGFDSLKVESVTIEAGGKSKTTARVETTDPNGQKHKKWGDPETKKADDTVGNFVDNTNNLRPTEYRPDLKVADLTLVLKLAYKDARGDRLGTLALYKREKPGELAPGAELDPANPPKNETEYLILTEKTRVPAVVRRDAAQRTEQDIATVFGDHPTSVEPKDNPLGNTPLPPANPHGGAARTGSGSAAGATGSGAATGSAGAATGSAGTATGAPAKADAPKAPADPHDH